VNIFKSVLIGGVAAAAAIVVWVAAKAAVSLQIGEGVGSMGFAISNLDITLAAVAGYCVGFFLWQRWSKRL
jgi:hypothetical protein